MDLSHPFYGALAVLFLGLALLRKGTGRLLGRLFMAGAPILILGAFALGLILPPGPLAQPVQQALVAGVVLATGWFVTFVIQEDRAGRERDRTRIDVLLALQAEIGNFLEKQEEIDFAANRSALDGAVAGGVDLKPFFFSEPTPIVFPAVISEMPLLDEQAVSAVVRFYAQIEDIVQTSHDLNHAHFLARPGEKRLEGYLAFIDMKIRAVALAKTARGAIGGNLARLGHQPEMGQNA